jgi:hypothetical protein
MNSNSYSTCRNSERKSVLTGGGEWQTGCEFDLSLSTNVNSKNEWRCTITPHINVYGVMSGMHKEKLYYFLPHAVHICTN